MAVYLLFDQRHETQSFCPEKGKKTKKNKMAELINPPTLVCLFSKKRAAGGRNLLGLMALGVRLLHLLCLRDTVHVLVGFCVLP